MLPKFAGKLAARGRLSRAHPPPAYTSSTVGGASARPRWYLLSAALILIGSAFIVLGGALGLGTSYLVSLLDGQITRTRQQEIDAWIQRHDPPTPHPVPQKTVSKTVIVPGPEGYLLEIPRIGVRSIVRELEPEVFSGKNTPLLKLYGLGQVPYMQYLQNVSPGAEGTAAIAGHRTTSGAPLRHLDRLAPGDIILIRKQGLEQQWTVTHSITVTPSAVETIRSRSATRRLALLACTPPFSDKERLVVYAQLAQEGARASALGTP